MFPFRTVELAFRRFQTRREPRALAFVFDRTAADLLALARHVAPPGTEPEDLVQATFVTAIEAAGSHRTGERVLPWLCGILGNHARAARRQARRPLDAARLPQPTADAAAGAEASELRAELAAAIDRLPEVYRPVLRLVLAHGLQANEVAKALERPAGTVRAQVARGLELLRRALPASLAGSAAVAVATGRGLAAVRTAVLGAAGGTGIVTVSPWFGGLLVLHQKLTAALAAAAVVLSSYWILRAPPPLPVQPIATEGAAAPASADLTALPVVDPQPDRIAAAPTPAPAAAEPGSATTGSLVVRVRAADGTPLPGIGVAVFPFAELQDLGRRMDYAPTDATGTVRFDQLAHTDWAIDVDRVGMAGVATPAPGRTVEREVTMPAGVRVEGRVVDARGTPQAAAEIVLHGSRAGTTVVARSDAAGAFALADLPAGVELQARAAGRAPSLAHSVRGAVGTTTALDLVLGDAGRTVRGVVLRGDGTPAEGAVVAILPARARAAVAAEAQQPQLRAQWCHCGADGTFVCDAVAAEPQLVFVRLLPFAPTWTEVDPTRDDATVLLQLTPGSALDGRVTGADGPVAGATVLAWPLDAAPIGYLQNLFGLRHATTAADGTFRLDGLTPGSHSVRLLQGTSLLRQETVTLAIGATATWQVDLATTPELRIVVRGAALPEGLQLMALLYPNPLRDEVPPAMAPVRRHGTAVVSVPRDGDVDVVLCTMPGGRSLLQLAAARAVPPHQTEVVFELLPEQLPRRGIAGRLVDAQRAPLAGRTVTAARSDGSGLVVRLDATTAADGSFVLGPLPAGRYTLFEGVAGMPQQVGEAVLTTERDERLGDLVLRPH
ncbi:MAG: sigma-70 family RNA polymerase sigma factor [Planctomycetes bacterium]|nr:sigma-70 family RNA polymerase sigma factor [Planctomycetota bacterium]